MSTLPRDLPYKVIAVYDVKRVYEVLAVDCGQSAKVADNEMIPCIHCRAFTQRISGPKKKGV
jgi:hypothetical protein